MNPDLTVDAEDLSATTSAIDGTASRVRAAASSAPGPVPGPHWAAVDAAAVATEAAERALHTIATDLSDTKIKIKETLAGYESADARAATRLRSAR